MKLTPDAQRKAAFIAGSAERIFFPNRMMMGLCNAPSNFQAAIELTLAALRHCTLVYIDDIIVFSQGSAEKHLETLMEVFRVLFKAGYKLNGKGTYFAREASFIGKIVSKEGIRPMPKHYNGLQDFKSPENAKQLSRFLGTLNWLRAFCRDYSRKTMILNDLLSAPVYKWTDEHEKVFVKMKAEINERSFLYFINEKLPLYLCSDACNQSYGALLYQVRAYSKEDIPRLKSLLDDPNTPQPDDVVDRAVHPALPVPKNSIPRTIPLQGNVESGTNMNVCPEVSRKNKSLSGIITHLQSDSTRSKTKESLLNPDYLRRAVANGASVPGLSTNLTSQVPSDISGATVPPPMHPSLVTPDDASKPDSVPKPAIKRNKISPSLTDVMQDGLIYQVLPVGYHSGYFRGAACNYSTLEKEAMGVTLNLAHFEFAMAGAPLTFLVTDSLSLCFLLRFRNTGIHKLERMCMKMFEYPFKIIVCHMKGTQIPADNFTRTGLDEGYYAITESNIRLTEAKKATVIYTPFAVGSVVSPREILEALQKCPDMVHVPSRPLAKSSKGPLPVKFVSASIFDVSSPNPCMDQHMVNFVSAPLGDLGIRSQIPSIQSHANSSVGRTRQFSLPNDAICLTQSNNATSHGNNVTQSNNATSHGNNVTSHGSPTLHSQLSNCARSTPAISDSIRIIGMVAISAEIENLKSRFSLDALALEQ